MGIHTSAFTSASHRRQLKTVERANAAGASGVPAAESDFGSEIDLKTLTKYIAYCRARCAPRLGAEAALLLQNHYVSIRSDVRARSKDGSNSTVPITVRQLEAIVRISESLAKMTLNRNVRPARRCLQRFAARVYCGC